MDLMALYERLCAFADDHTVFERERQRALAEAFDQTPDDKRSLWLRIKSADRMSYLKKPRMN